MADTFLFEDGTRAHLEGGVLSFYDCDEHGCQIGRRDYNSAGELVFCWFADIPIWVTPVRHGQEKKVGRCPQARRTGMYWDAGHHLRHVEKVFINHELRTGCPIIGSLRHQKITIGYLYEETDRHIPGSIRHVIMDTAGRETFCQSFDAGGLLYRQYTERHEDGIFVSARRAERQPDGSYRVFFCDEQGNRRSEEELPQRCTDTWPEGYSYRSPAEGKLLPENWWTFPEYWPQA